MLKFLPCFFQRRSLAFFACVFVLVQNEAAAQQFTAGRLVVERVGTGTLPTNAGTRIFVDEYTVTGVAGISLAMPTTTNSTVNRTVESGVATSDGMLTRSTDGHFLAVPGYDAAVGTAAVTGSPANKVITRVDASGGLSSTVVTNITAFAGNNFRGVVSADGNGYWMSGNGNGPVYVPHAGSTTPIAGTELATTSTDNRTSFIFQGQLYQSAASPAGNGIFEVSGGLPTFAGTTMTLDADLGAAGDPTGFVILDNGGTPVMYVNDFSNQLLYKYYFGGGVWNAAGSETITVSGTPTGFYGITGYANAGTVYLYATTTTLTGTNSKIVSFTDASGPTTSLSGTLASTIIAGPTLNTAFRGITFAPFNVSSIVSSAPAVCNGSGTTITIAGSPNTSVTYQINGTVQAPILIPASGTYSFATGPLTANATYTLVSATDGITTQTYSNSVTVVVNPLPTISVPAAAICMGSSTMLTASGALTYTWAGTHVSPLTGASVIANPTTTTVYTVTGTDINGCVNTTMVPLTVNSLPTITATPNTYTCYGSSIPLSASGASTYSWAPAAGLSTTAGAAISAGPSATTTYTVTGTDLNGCVNRSTVRVQVVGTPVITVSPNSTVCGGTTGRPLAASGALQYSWAPATGLSVTTGSSVTATLTSTTTYTVTGTDMNGCTASASVTISVNPLPTVNATSAYSAVCLGSSTTLNASGAFSYSWAPNFHISSTVGSNITATPTALTIYSVTGTDLNGCSNSTTVMVNVNPLPVVTTGPTMSICNGSSTTLSASGGLFYNWAPAVGLPITAGGSVTASPPSSLTYTVTVMDMNGCMGSGRQSVIVNYPSPVTAGAGPGICLGSSATLTAGGVGLSYSWSPATDLSSAIGSSVVATPLTTTVYTVTGTNIYGCTNSATTTVNVLPLPVVTVSGAAAICNGGAVFLNAAGATTYSWSAAAGLSGYTGSTVRALPAITTTYTVTGRDANGCVNSASLTVTVNPAPSIMVSPTATICFGGSTSLTAGGAVSYSWSPSLGLSGTAGSSVLASPTSSSSYVVTGTDANGCTGTASVSVNVDPLPSVYAGLGSVICSGATVPLHATGAAGYSWSPATGLSSTLGGLISATPATTTTYTVTGTTAHGCVNTSSVTVSVNPTPVAYAITGGGTYCASGTGLPIDLSGSDLSVHYQLYKDGWPVGTGRTGTGAAITFGAQTGAGTYTVVANNLISGCTANMTGAGTISVAPIPLVTTVTGGGAYCSGGAGVAIGITASVVGANYRLYRDTVAIDTPVAGPGRGFDFALQTIPGTYTVIATFPGTSCSSTMSGSATVSINSLPIVYAVTGGGEFCANGLGAHIGLSNGDLGVRYFLSGPGGTVNTIGHNTVLDFGEFTVPGVYKAFGKNSITGCLSYMKDSAIVIRDSVPTISAKRVEVMPGGTVNLTGTPTGGIWTSFVPAIATVGSTSGIVTGVAMGYTPITYTLPNGCHDKLNIYVTATGGLSVGQVNGNMNLNIIPNPNNGAFVLKGTLDIAVSDVAVELTNATGQVVYKDNVALNNGELNKEIKLTGMPAGVYFLQARTETNHTTLRLVIQ